MHMHRPTLEDFYLEMVDDPEVADLAVGGESEVAVRKPVA